MGIIQDALRDDPESVLLEGSKLAEKEEPIIEPEKPKVDEKINDKEKGLPEVVTPVTPEPVNKAKIYSELFEQDFETEEKAKEFYSSLKSSVAETDNYKKKIEELELGVDPLQYFANENEYKRQMLLKQFPDYDPVMITKATTSDLTKMNPLDILKLQIRLKDGDIFQSDRDAEGELEQKYGITLDSEFVLEELDPKIKNTILKDAKTAKGEFQTLRDSIKLPEKVDTKAVSEAKLKEQTAKTESLKLQLRPLLDAIPSKLKEQKITFTESDSKGGETVVFEYQIEDDFIKSIEKETEKTIDVLAQRGVELNTAQKNKVIEDSVKMLMENYAGKNIQKVLKAFKTKLDKDYADREVEDYHNPRKPKTEEAAKVDSVQQESIAKTEDKIERRMRGERV